MILEIIVLPLNYIPKKIVLSYEGFEPSSVWLTANYFTIKLVRFFYTGKDLNL